MFKIKVYLYDSSKESDGYRGEDFSKNVLQGNENTEDITEELDTSEITLAGLSFGEEFAPETKFIIDLIKVDNVDYENNKFDIEEIIATFHRCVSRDTVSKPILSDDNYFDHHISLIEPSVVAQKRLVDNIATTYKLKNVSLKEQPAFQDTIAKTNISSSTYTPSDNFGYVQYTKNIVTNVEDKRWGKYFELEGNVELLNTDGVSYIKTYNDIENFKTDDGTYKAKFNIPKLAIYAGVADSKDFVKIGYASIDYKIEEVALNDETNITAIYNGSFISNSDLSTAGAYSPLSSIHQNEWLAEESIKDKSIYRIGARKYTDINAQSPTYQTQEITISPDKQYNITISLHQFDDNLNNAIYQYFKTQIDTPAYFGFGEIWLTPILGTNGSSAFYNQMTTSQSSAICKYAFYNIDTKEIVYASSTPYSALALLQKAIINSSIYEKQDGVYIADINNSNLPFYIDPKFINELSATSIIENFYNQKNLWEIMVEAGHYIHAIPELKFGSDDRFMITFNRLGQTEQHQDNSTKISIFNSRNVEDYISATSSYITNMVQLDGYIEEWVVPKTTNEQFLVSNDTAEIIVSKPIIELLEIKVVSNIDQTIGDLTLKKGQSADLTEYIYEENVYKTLSIDYKVIPNRGIAMYYSLGKNVITGGQFQLPQANTNIYSDYTFKKIIYSAFGRYPTISNPIPIDGYWKDLLISDFSFLVRYRTKDSVRENHIRPDLRKYLLNSKYDRFPEHNQFNNQTDVVVDSIKFGNNVYGKLIKTGNSSYEIYEWNDNYDNVKHKGELYKIGGDLYYVATATHYYYSSYILSKITYSKDYNELSAVIGIPSEPRFYEISEQSLIRREFAINDILLMTDKKDLLEYKSNYVLNFEHLSNLILGEGTDFAKYAVTVYKGDKDVDKYDQTIGQSNLYKEVINPVNAYSSENTLTYEWDMIDNYSAGDKVIDVDVDMSIAQLDERAYNSLRAVSYTDIYGKSALLDFYILGDIGDLSAEEKKALPESPIKTKQDEEDTRNFIGDYDILATNVLAYDTDFNGRGIGLLKDCREAMSINYNLQLATDSDTFVISPYFYLPKKENIRIVLLAEEVNKLSSGYINNSTIITPIDINGATMSKYFTFDILTDKATSTWNSTEVVTNFWIDLTSVLGNVANEHFTDNQDFQRIKSIAVLCDVNLNIGVEDKELSRLPYKTQFIFARNIPDDWSKEKALSPIYFGSPNKNNLFKNKQ